MNDISNRLRENGPSSGFGMLMDEAADFIESQTKIVLAYIDQHARDSAELRRLCYERDKAKERVQALEAKCALLAASLAQSEGEVEERDGRIATLTTVAPAVDAQPVGVAGAMPGTDGFTMAAFKASEVPVGTPLYTSAQSEGLRKDAIRRAALEEVTQEVRAIDEACTGASMQVNVLRAIRALAQREGEKT